MLVRNLWIAFRHGRLVATLQPTVDRAPCIRGVHSSTVASDTNGWRVESRSSSSPASHIPNRDGGCLAAIILMANHGGTKLEGLGLLCLKAQGGHLNVVLKEDTARKMLADHGMCFERDFSLNLYFLSENLRMQKLIV